MEWYEWLVITGLGMALLGARWFRFVLGYRCPSCDGARLQRLGIIHETFVSMRSLWSCSRCGSRFLQHGWGNLKKESAAPGISLGDD